MFSPAETNTTDASAAREITEKCKTAVIVETTQNQQLQGEILFRF